MEKIGWIGTGVMGRSMCLHVLRKGYPISVFNRTKEQADDLCRQSAVWCDRPIWECSRRKKVRSCVLS